MRIRCSARVIAINKDKRVLLFKYEADSIFGSQGPIGKPFWVTPGGGVEDQETYEDAAKRELFEESGLVPVALSKCIWNRIIELTWKGELIQSQEKYYVAYVEEADIKLDNLTLEERDLDSFKLLFFSNAYLMSVRFDINEEVISLPLDVITYVSGLDKFLKTKDFYEYGFNYEIHIFGNITHVYSEYEAKASLEAITPVKSGVNFVQLINAGGKWKILNILWQDK